MFYVCLETKDFRSFENRSPAVFAISPYLPGARIGDFQMYFGKICIKFSILNINWKNEINRASKHFEKSLRKFREKYIYAKKFRSRNCT